MILLDTHIWIWWVDGNRLLKDWQKQIIQENESEGLGISAISCWEVAKLVEIGKLRLACPVEEWMEMALAYPGVQLLELTPQIAIESTKLPGDFHKDPADQMIVATARKHDIYLLTADDKILNYPYVKTLLTEQE
ncbi:MAG: type II toxin-antitoxin system VapC family toxin [Desulfobacterales bacterium]|nr:type II toxin-antitoxin system VapC family toxin [Desulfobacterales bacterium]